MRCWRRFGRKPCLGEKEGWAGGQAGSERLGGVSGRQGLNACSPAQLNTQGPTLPSLPGGCTAPAAPPRPPPLSAASAARAAAARAARPPNWGAAAAHSAVVGDSGSGCGRGVEKEPRAGRCLQHSRLPFECGCGVLSSHLHNGAIHGHKLGRGGALLAPQLLQQRGGRSAGERRLVSAEHGGGVGAGAAHG